MLKVLVGCLLFPSAHGCAGQQTGSAFVDVSVVLSGKPSKRFHGIHNRREEKGES